MCSVTVCTLIVPNYTLHLCHLISAFEPGKTTDDIATWYGKVVLRNDDQVGKLTVNNAGLDYHCRYFGQRGMTITGSQGVF